MARMSVDSLKANLTNPARTYLWEMIIPAIPGAGGQAEDLLIRCQSTSLPGRSVGVIPVPYKQSAGIQFHGKLTYSHSWTCTFIEGEDHKVHDAIHAWNNFIVDDLDNVGQGDTMIKSDIYLNLLTTKGEDYREVRLIGCFPMEVADVDMSYDDENVVKFSVTFSYDKWEDNA